MKHEIKASSTSTMMARKKSLLVVPTGCPGKGESEWGESSLDQQYQSLTRTVLTSGQLARSCLLAPTHYWEIRLALALPPRPKIRRCGWGRDGR